MIHNQTQEHIVPDPEKGEPLASRDSIDSAPREGQPVERRGSDTSSLLTLQEVAGTTGRNVELLRRWAVSGRIPARRMGRDWFVRRGDLVVVERMPRRRVSGPTGRLDDRSLLNENLNHEIDDCLEPAEATRVVLAGAEESALVATDRRVLVAHDGVLVRSPGSGRPASWPLGQFRRVQLDATASTGALVLTPADPNDRAIVLLLSKPQLARATAAVDALRALLEAAGSYDAKGSG